MVKTLKDKDMPEPWFGKKSKQVMSTPKQTRATSRQMASHRELEDDIVEEAIAVGEAREKGKGTEDISGKVSKKAKAVRPATADVVFGKSKYAVPDPEEQRRKMIADASACGRVVKSVSQPGSRKSCPTTAPLDPSEGRPNAEIVTGEDHTVMDHFGSPVHGIPHAGEGIDNSPTEHGNEAPNPVRGTPLGHRSGKEPFHDEIQQPEECAVGLQGSGKRKSRHTVVVSSTSTERSDPEGSARKHRRLNRSHSPILLKERVS
jgi:hypothetical protein